MKDLTYYRRQFELTLPDCFNDFSNLSLKKSEITKLPSTDITSYFPNLSNNSILEITATENPSHKPLKVGAVFSGGPAAGGNNVLAGLYFGLKKLNSQSELLGFLGGPNGIIDNRFIAIDEEFIKISYKSWRV